MSTVRRIIMVLLVAAGIGTLSPKAYAFSVHIDPGAYTGQYTVAGPGLFSGPRTVDLPAGTHTLTVGGVAESPTANSYFRFTVDAAGQITSVLNSANNSPSGAAVVVNGTTLRLNNVSITVDPGAYAGTYGLFSHGVSAPCQVLFQGSQGPKPFVLVPDLLGRMCVGGVAESPTAYSYFRFVVDAAGQITSVLSAVNNGPSGAAVASGSTLSLNNVSVRVDPTTYAGTYRVAGYLSLSGSTVIVLVPSLLAAVVTPGEGGSIVPDVGQVTPPSLLLSIGGTPHTFYFSVVSQPLVAYAGPDQTVNEGVLVTLDGSGSSADVVFSWQQPAGPGVQLSDATAAQPTFTAPLLPGGFGSQTLTFQVTVSSGGQSHTDTVDVTVVNINHAPIADAGGA